MTKTGAENPLPAEITGADALPAKRSTLLPNVSTMQGTASDLLSDEAFARLTGALRDWDRRRKIARHLIG